MSNEKQLQSYIKETDFHIKNPTTQGMKNPFISLHYTKNTINSNPSNESLIDLNYLIEDENEKDEDLPDFHLLNCDLGLNTYVKSKIEFELECYQLNIDGIFQENTYDTDIKENCSACFEKAKRYFDNVSPIPSANGKELVYDSSIDFLPNLNSLTNLELSLLREVACGCKPLTWDEYEKLNVIEYKAKDSTKNLKTNDSTKNLKRVRFFDNPENVPRKKIIREDLKFFHHETDPENRNELYISDKPSSDDDLSHPIEKDYNNSNEILEDPLEMDNHDENFVHTPEQNKSENKHKETSHCTEFLSFSEEELSNIKARMKLLQLNVNQNDLLDSVSSKSDDFCCEIDPVSDQNLLNDSDDVVVIDVNKKNQISTSSQSVQCTSESSSSQSVQCTSEGSPSQSVQCTSEETDFVLDFLEKNLINKKNAHSPVVSIPVTSIINRSASTDTTNNDHTDKNYEGSILKDLILKNSCELPSESKQKTGSKINENLTEILKGRILSNNDLEGFLD